MKFSSSLPLFALVAAFTLGASPAYADDKAACLAATQKGQRLRDTHKLVEAREQLRICAAATCPAVIQADCATWLAEAEKAIPTMVFGARSGAGVDLIDVKVSVDGQLLVAKLDGHAVSINAGPHTFTFVGADGTTVDKQLVVKEGERNVSLSVVLGPVAPVVAPAAAPDAASSSSGWRTAGWVMGGVGVVGLGVGALFGGLGLSAKGSDCNGVVCKVGTTSGIKTDAALSDVGFIVGGLLVAGGAGILLFGPHAGTTGTASIAPMLLPGGGAVVAGGTF